MDFKILPPTDDWIFKLLFGDERNKSMLIDLLKAFVELPQEEYELSFLDTSLKPENEDEKLGILDVKVKTKTGKVIDIEIQVNPERNIGQRLSFYKSKLIVEQIGKGELYHVIQKVICICITNYELFPEANEYVNIFRFTNKKNGLIFEVIPEEIYTLELPKVPALSDGSAGWEWMQFLRAKQKEEFEMVAVKNPEIRKAVDTLYQLSSDEQVQAEHERRLKAWRDRASQLEGSYLDGKRDGKKEGIQEGKKEGIQEGKMDKAIEAARKMKAGNVPVDQIVEYLELTEEQIKSL
ncbi:Rpn family recombination-promoting nuclease/putative transposase [Treponema sp. R80B11-R83G3]